MILASLFYLIGCIGFRKYNKLTVITAILLFLSSLVVQGFIGLVMLFQGFYDNSFVITYLFIGLYIQGFLWVLHNFLFIFSKKRIGWEDDDEDQLSVENGGAFSSYISDDNVKKKQKKKRKKKEKSSDNDDFTFDF